MSHGEDAFTDIANAILALSITFRRHGMSSPKSIELAGRDDYNRLRHLSPSDLILCTPTVERGSAEMKVNIAGVDLMAPIQYRAQKKGGYIIE